MARKVEGALAEIQRTGISGAEHITGRDRTTIWRYCRKGKFPPPQYIGARRTWLVATLLKWVEEEAARPASERAINLGQYARPKANREHQLVPSEVTP